MKYQFSLESVLKHRKNIEVIAQREFFEAQSAVEKGLSELSGLYDIVEMARQSISEIQTKGGRCSEVLQKYEVMIEGMRIRIETKRKEVRELIKISDEKREILIEAAKEFKVLEKLKEKEFEKVKKIEKTKEVKRADDIVTMRFKGRR